MNLLRGFCLAASAVLTGVFGAGIVCARAAARDAAPPPLKQSVADAKTSAVFARWRPVQAVRQIAPGVTLIQQITPAGAVGGPLAVHVLKIAPQNAVRVEAALGRDRVWAEDANQGRETISDLTLRRGALIGINAGFFPYQGNPIGLHFSEGEIVTEPNGRTSLVLLQNGTAFLETFTGRIRARFGDQEVLLTGMNRKPTAPEKSDVVLYTPRFGDATPPQAGRVEVVLSGGPPGPLLPNQSLRADVREVRVGGKTPLRAGTVVVSAGGPIAAEIRALAFRARVAQIVVEAIPASGRAILWPQVSGAVTGGPRLVQKGQVVITSAVEKFSASFVKTRHPRTAAGVAADGTLILMAVDGRQNGFSQGVTLPELAALLVRFGAIEALNLDGGGSTTLAFGGGVLNAPSGLEQRPVADALLVFPAKTTTSSSEAKNLTTVIALEQPLRIGERIQFMPETQEGKITSDTQTVWSVTGAIGFVDQQGLFEARRAGNGRVLLARGGMIVAIPVFVASPIPAAGLP